MNKFKKNALFLKELTILAKNIVLAFFGIVLKENNDYSPEKVDKIRTYLDSYKIKTKDFDSLSKCNNETHDILISQIFIHEDYSVQLFVLIHEYVHAMSAYVCNLTMPSVIEEGLAEVIAELALSKNTKLSTDFCHKRCNYLPCAELMKKLLSMTNEYEFIYNYFFKDKNCFCNYFTNKFGEKSSIFLSDISVIDPLIDEDISDEIRIAIETIFENTIENKKRKFDNFN